MKSIRRFLLQGLLAALVLTFVLVFFISYRQAAYEVNELYDAQLVQTTRFIEGFLDRPASELDLDHVNQALREAASVRYAQEQDSNSLGHRYEQKLAVQLWDQAGNLLIKTPTAPMYALSPLKQGFYSKQYHGYGWYVYTHAVPSNGYWLVVAERSDVRAEVTEKLAESLLAGLFIAVVLVAVLIWFIVSRGLRPLTVLSAQISERDLDHLQPVDPGGAPDELAPVVSAINLLFDRVESGVERERRFLGDVAHELRTPLAALRLQAQSGLSASDLIQAQSALHKVMTGVDRSMRLVEQLLTLARLEPEAMGPREEVSLKELARDCVLHMAPVAARKDQQLGLDMEEEPAMLMAYPVLVGVLMRNLVENAIRYSPEGANIRLLIGTGEGSAYLQVEDDGPGVDESVLPMLSQRFFRHQKADTTGTGLGLSIVARIAQIHGATVEFSNVAPHGLRVIVRFPKSRPD